MRRLVLVVPTILVFVLLFPVSGPLAQPPAWVQEEKQSTPLDQRRILRERDGRAVGLARVNFEQGYVETTGMATADPQVAKNQAHAITLALEAARLLAYVKLAETVSGLSLRADTLLGDLMLRRSEIKAAVEAKIRGARVVREKYDFTPAGEVLGQVTVGLLLHGSERSLMSSVVEFKIEGPSGPTFRPDLVGLPVPPEPYTGLIIDASGLKARPALVPKIKTYPDRQELYGPESVEREIFLNSGLVGYAASVDKAKRLVERVGPNPLVVLAVRSDGAQGSDLLVEKDVAQKILAADLKAKFLRKARVVVVVN